MNIDVKNVYGFKGWTNGSRQALESFVFANEPKLYPKAMRLVDKIDKMSPNHTIKFTQTELNLQTRNGGTTNAISATLPLLYVRPNNSDKFVRVTSKESGIYPKLKALKNIIKEDNKAHEKLASKLRKKAK